MFASKKTVVFVDGCFWHMCPEHFQIPATRSDFWEKKITGNRNRDIEVTKTLEKNGWTVIRIWEHEIRNNIEEAADKVERLINSRN